ncbi:MAG: SMP-30/gluconolactonase/LRE family protein [Prolixibacteraceae bacterium]|nr:SMP-30/gluconolactonase/LRE family protein [Prolixibacteraceae bacterium]
MKNTVYLVCILLFVMSCTESGPKVELVIDTKSDLGEGAIWNYRTNELYWVNIAGKLLHIYNPQTGINKELLTGQMIGTVVPTESGRAIVALQNGIYYLDVSTGTKTFLVDPEDDKPDNRFNDGKCDPKGRLWAGTMNLNGDSEKGALYRIENDSTVTKMIYPVSISNGITWSADTTRMYYIDTPTQQVKQYDYNNSTGTISNGKVVIEIPTESGSPDGMTIDKDGNLWIALWGGYAVGCWNPETGELVRKIDVPAKNVTSCAFGGPDLKTLFITTARQDMSEDELKEFPHAGGVFKIRQGVEGVKACFFNDVI